MSDCSLSVTLHGQDAVLSLEGLRKMCEEDPTVNLYEELKGGKLAVNWPHRRPPPTGSVRAQLIHARMHRAARRDPRPEKLSLGRALTQLSWIFTLVITLPAVAFAVYSLCIWLKLEETRAKLIGLVAGLLSFFVELGLILIQAWKTERREKKATARSNAKVD
jgi:hypothetical protein